MKVLAAADGYIIATIVIDVVGATATEHGIFYLAVCDVDNVVAAFAVDRVAPVPAAEVVGRVVATDVIDAVTIIAYVLYHVA